jgi:transcriptional regulator
VYVRPDFGSAQTKGIVGVEMPIHAIYGTWKASQNQPAVNRAGVIEGLRAEDANSPMARIVEEAD